MENENLRNQEPDSCQGRDAILRRIRSALAKPAPPCESVSDEIPLFPPTGNLVEHLQTELKSNGIDCVLTEDVAGSARAMQAEIAVLPPGEVFVQDAPELRALMAELAPGLCPVGSSRTVRWSSEGPAAEDSQATITLTEALVASSGSIVVSSGCGGRAGSIVAPCHLVYAKTNQIVADLGAAMDHIEQSGMLKNSFVGFITGASRTGDIEKIVVHGAHGPRKVIVVLEADRRGGKIRGS